MNYTQQTKSGFLVLPSALLFHIKDLFPNTQAFLVWQFLYFQNTSALEELAPSQIAEAMGLTITEVNHSIELLQEAQLLDLKNINLNGEIEILFDATPAIEALDQLLLSQQTAKQPSSMQSSLKELLQDFERELGMLSPLMIEEIQKTVQEDHVSVDLVRAALREAVFNNKTSWNYIQAILRNWRREGITSVAQVEARKAEREQAHPKQVQMSDDFLNAMDLWKD